MKVKGERSVQSSACEWGRRGRVDGVDRPVLRLASPQRLLLPAEVGSLEGRFPGSFSTCLPAPPSYCPAALNLLPRMSFPALPCYPPLAPTWIFGILSSTLTPAAPMEQSHLSASIEFDLLCLVRTSRVEVEIPSRVDEAGGGKGEGRWGG